MTVSPGAPARGFAPRSTLIPGMIPRLWSSSGNGVSSLGRLADRLVVEDHTADELLHVLRGEEELAVGTAVVLVRLDADRVEALLDRAGALVGGEDPLALGDELLGDRLQVGGGCSHRSVLLRFLAEDYRRFSSIWMAGRRLTDSVVVFGQVQL